MKQGRYLRVPERPSDMDRLWDLSAPLELNSLPNWLSPGDADYYRLAAAVPVAGLLSAERHAYLAESTRFSTRGSPTRSARSLPP